MNWTCSKKQVLLVCFFLIENDFITLTFMFDLVFKLVQKTINISKNNFIIFKLVCGKIENNYTRIFLVINIHFISV